MARSWRSQIADEVRACSRMKPKWTLENKDNKKMTATKNELQKFFKWIDSDDTGLSSISIASHMISGWSSGSTPSDISDLGRCMRLLEEFPDWQVRLPEMARYNKTWKALSENWTSLTKAFYKESNIDDNITHKRPKTWELLKSILESVNKNA